MTSLQYVNWQGRMLDRYQLLQVVGRGGMGEVWLAEDTKLRRHVAIKLLPAVLASDKNYLRDFVYEARTLAGLEHPHVLPVHDFGEQMVGDEVIPYLVMPYITGGSLRDRIRSVTGLLPTEVALSVLAESAEAIDYAHSQHILHRDIKPGNILLQNGWLLLADFGLAKLLSSATHRTRTHIGAGTPEYMAPEQAMGKAEVASDRYSLAVIAYQLFTGHLPFQGETSYAMLIKHMREVPPFPRQLHPEIPQRVEDTLLQGLAKRPEERPASCSAFVNALEREWGLHSQSLTDPEATVLAPWSKRRQELRQGPRTWKSHLIPFVTPPAIEHREHPITVETLQEPTHVSEERTYIATVASVPSSPDTLPIREQIQEIPSPSLEQRKEIVSRRTFVIGGVTTVAVATGLVLPALLHHATPVVTKPPVVIPGPKHLIPGVPVLNITGHTDQVWDVVWDPTGRYIATAGQDTRVMLWDVGSALQKSAHSFQTMSTPINSWKFGDAVYHDSLDWSANGRSLLTVASDSNLGISKIRLLDAFHSNKTSIYTNDYDTKNENSYLNIAWRPNTQNFAASVYETPHSVRVDMWEVGHTQQTSRVFRYPDADDVMANELAWSLDGTMLASGLNNFKVVVWETTTGKVLHAIPLPARTNKSYTTYLRGAIAWSPVDPNILLASDIDVGIVLNVKQNKVLHILGTDNPDALTIPKPNPDDWVPNILGLAWSPNGRYIVGGYGHTSKICLWDMQNKTPTIKKGVHIQDTFIPASSSAGGHNDIVIDVAWSSDGRYLATASADKTVLIWKMDAS